MPLNEHRTCHEENCLGRAKRPRGGEGCTCHNVVQLDFAVQQFKGWQEARYGAGSIVHLVQAMGLSYAEFRQLGDYLYFLKPHDREDIIEYFIKRGEV